MKVAYVVIVAAAVGATLGAGIGWARFGGVPPLALAESETALPLDTEGRRPKLLVDRRLHNFGSVDRDSHVAHAFRFTNVGDAPLELKAGRTTCSRCTIAELSQSTVLPRETAEVTVEYLPSGGKRRFQQIAVIYTNDPDEPRVELTISGQSTSRYQILPRDLNFSNVSTKATKTVSSVIYSYWSEEIKLVGHEFTTYGAADHFDVQSELIPRDQLTEPEARAGLRVNVTVKPGLPLGPIQQTIRLKLALGADSNETTVDVPIFGTIDSDISVVGRGWNADIALLKIGVIESAKGAARSLFLVVRGPERHRLTLKVAKVEPAWIEVAVGEPKELKKDAPADSGVVQIPLTLSFPKGAPPCNHLGNDQGDYGQIMLETNHPQVGKIPIYLQFVVKQ